MVVTPIASGSIVLLIGLVDPLFGLGPLLGVLLLCAASCCCCASAIPHEKSLKTPAFWWRPSTGASLPSTRAGHALPPGSSHREDEVIEDLGGGPSKGLRDGFETEQRFVAVDDEGKDDVWCLRLAVGVLDLQVHRAPMAGTVVAGEHRRAVDAWPERLRWVIESAGRRAEVVAHLVRPRFALTPLAVPGDAVRRGQRLAFMSTTPLLDFACR